MTNMLASFSQHWKNFPLELFDQLVTTKKNKWENGLNKTLKNLKKAVVCKYNNLTVTGQWKPTGSKKSLEAKVVAMQAEIEMMRSNQNNNQQSKGSGNPFSGKSDQKPPRP